MTLASTLEYPTSTLHRLTDSQRQSMLRQLHDDGFIILPGLLPDELFDGALAALDRCAAAERANASGRTSVKLHNIVDRDPAFVALMMYEPALQLAHDCFGPIFHLCQSNLVSRPRDVKTGDYLGSSPWHADGPRPAMFPSVGGEMGLHFLKFGYFLTDLTHATGGSLQVVRGSHRRQELDGADHGKFDIGRYRDDLVQLDCPAGTVVAFHQAQWHAAQPNQSDVERKNCYLSYCPTWVKPLDREYPSESDLAGRSPEERWLLGEPRPALRWWLPSAEDTLRLQRFARDANPHAARKLVRYE